ncbi:hypothetical protein OG542_19480 [Streptomyces violaceus]
MGRLPVREEERRDLARKELARMLEYKRRGTMLLSSVTNPY